MKSIVYAGCLLASVAAVVAASHHSTAFSGLKGSLSSPDTSSEEALPIGSLALENRYIQRLDADGSAPADGMARAVRQREELLKVQGNDPASGPTWTYLGPDNVGGRVRSIVFHPTNPNTYWVGSVGGGIWKTVNGGATYSPADDFLPSLCVGTIVIDPSSPNVLYAGTGESYFDTTFGENNKAAIQGAGIYKTTDSGATWTQLPSTAIADFNCVARLAMNPSNSQILLAATNTGIFRSSDGGGTWTQVYVGKTYDIDFNPTDSSRVVAGLPQAPGVVTSSDGGLTWQASTGITSTVRCETCWSKSVPGNVYAGVANANYVKVWKSTDYGHTWVLKSTGTGPSNYDAYNDAIWVDPTNDNNVIVAGVSVYRSTNGGANISSAFTSVHSDFHVIQESSAFDGSGNKTVYFGTDGGVSRAANYTSNTTTDLNNTLGITQFYGGAMNDTTGHMVAGAQDNYSQVYTGSLNWFGVIGGDGVYCANDPAFPSTFYAGYYYLNLYRSTDGGSSFPTYVTSGITDSGTNVNCNFIPYIELDPNQSNTMLACARRLWRSTNIRTSSNPTWTIIKPPIASGPDPLPGSHYPPPDHFAPEYPYNLSFCAVSPSDSNVIWAGHNNGQVYMTVNGTAASPSWTRVDLNGPLPARWVSCIVVDPTNASHVYITFMGWDADNVWETTDGGATFQPITGTGLRHIPSAPVSALAVDPLRPGHLLVGTDIGIFTTWDNGATWSVATHGPGTVPIDFFQWRNNSQLIAYTYGRGAWQGNVSPTATAVQPFGFNVVRGILVSGGLNDVLNSDDQYLIVRNGPVPNQNQPPISIEFQGTAPDTVAGSITLKCEASVSTVGLAQDLLAYNYDTASWVTVDTRTATKTDQLVSTTLSSGVSSFVDPTTRSMKFRLQVHPQGPVGTSGWSAKVDLAAWSVSD